MNNCQYAKSDGRTRLIASAEVSREPCKIIPATLPMTFEEWADLLELRAKFAVATEEGDRVPWRCVGPCGQLMYGIEWIDDKPYPTPENTPAGLFISKEIPHVCHVCWEMYHAVEKSPTGYWQGLSSGDKKVIDRNSRGGNYLAT